MRATGREVEEDDPLLGKKTKLRDESYYKNLVRKERRAKGLPSSSDESDPGLSDIKDAQAWFRRTEVSNHYEVTPKGKYVLVDQRRGFYGFNIDEEYRQRAAARRVSVFVDFF